METTETQLIKINPAEFGIEESKATQIAEQFQPMLDKMKELEAEYNEVIQIPIDDVSAKFKASELRKKYVKVRTGTAEIHKQQKAFYLSAGRFIDGWKNAQLFASEGLEKRLQEIENHFENLEKQKIVDLNNSRLEILKEYNVDGSTMNLGTMTDNVWVSFLSGTKMEFENKKTLALKAEEERLAKEKAEAEEQARVKAENEKLKIENEAKEKQLAEAEALRKSEQEKADKILAEQKRIADEKEVKAKIESEAKLKSEREAKEKQETELSAQKEKERIAEEEKQAKELSESKARTKALNAPEKTKLIALSKTVRAIELPTVSTDEAKIIVQQVEGLIRKLCSFIDEKSETL